MIDSINQIETAVKRVTLNYDNTITVDGIRFSDPSYTGVAPTRPPMTVAAEITIIQNGKSVIYTGGNGQATQYARMTGQENQWLTNTFNLNYVPPPYSQIISTGNGATDYVLVPPVDASPGDVYDPKSSFSSFMATGAADNGGVLHSSDVPTETTMTGGTTGTGGVLQTTGATATGAGDDTIFGIQTEYVLLGGLVAGIGLVLVLSSD